MIDALDGANRVLREQGDWSLASTYITWQALAMLEDGHPSADVEPLVDEAAAHTSPYDVISMSYVHAARSVLAARSGELDSARDHAAEAVRIVDISDQVMQQADVRRWVSEAARAAGDTAEERRLLTEARDLYRLKEMVVYDDDLDRRLAELDEG